MMQVSPMPLGPSTPSPSPSAATTSEPVSAWAKAVEDTIARSGVPKRYRDVKPSKILHRWAYIDGSVGVGKTYTACMILRKYVEENTGSFGVPHDPCFFGPFVRFTTAMDYLTAIKGAFSEDGSGRSSAIRRCDFLVLDDLGQETPTAWAVEQLWDLVNYRYNEDKPIVITSQFPLGEIADRLSRQGGREQAEAIASRLAQCCEPLHMEGVDRRLQ